MQYARPKLVGDAIKVSEAGLHVGVYGPYRLYSAYQPIFSLSEPTVQKASAFEGLIRPFKEGEAVRPDVFLSSLNKRDFLFIECMCRALHLRNYRHAMPTGKRLFVNLDLARYQSREDMKLNFDIYCERAAKHGLTIDNMVFEVVESAPADKGLLTYTRDILKERGVKIAVDDYGQKHSTLQRCLLLNPDILKVDRRLFLNALKNSAVSKLLKSQLHQFRENGTIVLIEGIETQQQFVSATDFGAELFQGFLFSQPHVLPWRFEETHTVTKSDGLSAVA